MTTTGTAASRLLGAMAALAPILALAGPGYWTPLGPEGGTVGPIQVDPSTPGTVYMIAGQGIYKSENSGVDWQLVNHGIDSKLGSYIYRTPLIVKGNLVYTSDGCAGFYRSTNGAQTWSLTGYDEFGNGSGCITAGTRTTGALPRLLVGNEHGGIVASDNDGLTFYRSDSGMPDSYNVLKLAASPASPDVVLALISITNGSGTPHGIFRSDDGGTTWNRVFTFTSYPSVTANFSFGTDERIYASDGDHVLRSDDSGLNWVSLDVDNVIGIAADPDVPDLVYFTAYDGNAMQSTNGGMTTTDISAGQIMANSAFPAQLDDIAIVPNGASTDLLVGTNEVGVFRLHEDTWMASNKGVKESWLRNVTTHPTANGKIFAGYEGSGPGIKRSDDGGATWVASNTGLIADEVRRIVFDPTTVANPATSIMYASGIGGYDYQSSVYVGSGIWKSIDGGVNWQALTDGIPDTGYGPLIGIVRGLALDPRSCAIPPPAPNPCITGPLQTIYAIAGGNSGHNRVIRSLNGGDFWDDIDSLPPPVQDGSHYESMQPLSIVIDPLNPLRLFIGSMAGYPFDGITPQIDNGVFRSDDGGENWSLMSDGLPLVTGSTTTHYDIPAMAIDPQSPDTVWVAVDNLSDQQYPSPVFKTLDGGVTWLESSQGITAGNILHLLVDPELPTTLYAAANDSNVYKSVDGGTNWFSISIGLGEFGALSLAIDPDDSSVLNLATNRGVYQLQQLVDTDHDGVPDSVEQSGPNGGDENGDGIADYLQPGVSAIDIGTAGAGASNYLVVDVVPDTPGTCGQIVDAHAVSLTDRPLNTVADVSFEHAVPNVRFEILGCPSASVRLIYRGSTFDATSTMRFFGPNAAQPYFFKWHDFSARSTPIDAQTWELQLDAGGFGSYRPLESGSILFEGGPASAETIFRNGFDG